MKTILAFGDSITWGADPGNPQGRHAFEDRWTSVLETGLGGRAHVIAEGLRGRSTVWSDPTVDEERNGAVALPMLLKSHEPLDLVIVFLGTNDLKVQGRRAFDAGLGLKRLCGMITRFPWTVTAPEPAILLVAPPAVVETRNRLFSGYFGHAIAESHNFASVCGVLAQDLNVNFYDAGSVARASPADGVHLDAENTRAIGKGLVPVVNEILGL